MARHKDENWDMSDSNSWDVAKLAVLMDIRDELKQLNRLLSCRNFLEIPFKLNQIVANTTKKPKLKAVKKKAAA